MAPVPRATPPPRSPLRCVSAAVDRLRTFGVAACNRVSNGAHGIVCLHTYHIPRAQPAHHFARAHPRHPSSHAGRAWKPAPTVGWAGLRTTLLRRTHVAPTPQSRRNAPRQLPFQGSRGWADTWGFYALVYRDADTVVFLPPVRGGVLDAPRLRDCRGGLGADVGRGRLRRRLIRRAQWHPPPNVSYPAGTARAPFGRRAGPTSSVIRRKGRRGRRPLRWLR